MVVMEAMAVAMVAMEDMDIMARGRPMLSPDIFPEDMDMVVMAVAMEDMEVTVMERGPLMLDTFPEDMEDMAVMAVAMEAMVAMDTMVNCYN